MSSYKPSPLKRLSAEALAKLDNVDIDGPALSEAETQAFFATFDVQAALTHSNDGLQASPRVRRGRRRNV
ncbi:MAG: hypothetical protein CTY31_12550 [Hyphomicrobium sp.]|nr:MAG: hypothetical protein CTY31_12550 [Hyphomicrobium sp.]